MLCTPPAFILSQDQTLEIIVLKHNLSAVVQSLLSSSALSFFYFCLSSILFVRISEIRFKLFALYFSLVVQFSRIICRRSCVDLSIIPLSFSLVNTFSKSFSTFFKVFSSSRKQLGRSPCGQLVYYTLFSIKCQHLFSFFFTFSIRDSFTTTFCTTFYLKSLQNHQKRCDRPVKSGISRDPTLQ